MNRRFQVVSLIVFLLTSGLLFLDYKKNVVRVYISNNGSENGSLMINLWINEDSILNKNIRNGHHAHDISERLSSFQTRSKELVVKVEIPALKISEEVSMNRDSVDYVFISISHDLQPSSTVHKPNFNRVSENWIPYVSDYEGLLSGERQKFSAGESSLFMVNSRELGFIKAQITYLDLLAANQKAILNAEYALGTLFVE